MQGVAGIHWASKLLGRGNPKPIQDLSAVSITDKTVGIRLPRLWCGAGGRRTKHPIKSHQAATRYTELLTESNLLLPPVAGMRRSLARFHPQVVIFKGLVLWHNRCAGR